MMRNKIVAVLVGVAMAVSAGQVADASSDNANGGKGSATSASKRAMMFHGTVMSTDADGDVLTEGPLVVEVTKANGNGRRYLAGSSTATFIVTEGTRYFGAASSSADLAVGDRVKVKARGSEAGLTAQRVKEKRVEA